MAEFKGIITSDWHLRKDVPAARPEEESEWIDFQFKVIEQMQYVAIKNELDIYLIGDLYERSQPYMGIIGRLKVTFERFERKFIKLAGNHDLPYHSWKNMINSGWFLSPGIDLSTVNMGAFHFGNVLKRNKAKIVFTHQLVFPDEKSKPPMAGGKTAQELLDEYPHAEWIFTGDYHKAFHYENDGSHVVNPGCLIRQSATEEEYDTGFYIVDTAKNLVKFVSVEDTVEMNTAYLKNAKDRDSRIEAFMEVLESKGKVTLSYKDNLKKKLLNKKISKGIRDIVTEIKEEINKMGVMK